MRHRNPIEEGLDEYDDILSQKQKNIEYNKQIKQEIADLEIEISMKSLSVEELCDLLGTDKGRFAVKELSRRISQPYNCGEYEDENG